MTKPTSSKPAALWTKKATPEPIKLLSSADKQTLINIQKAAEVIELFGRKSTSPKDFQEDLSKLFRLPPQQANDLFIAIEEKLSPFVQFAKSRKPSAETLRKLMGAIQANTQFNEPRLASNVATIVKNCNRKELKNWRYVTELPDDRNLDKYIEDSDIDTLVRGIESVGALREMLPRIQVALVELGDRKR